jgi:CRP-like cAMP-binding protein
MVLLEIPAGVTVVAEGERAGDFYVLLGGEARVHRDGETVAELGPGDFFGEIALVARTRRTASVTTTEPSTLVALQEPEFRGLLDRDAAFSARVWAAAEARL